MGLRFEPKKRSVAIRQLPKTVDNRRYMTLVCDFPLPKSAIEGAFFLRSSFFIKVVALFRVFPREFTGEIGER